MSDNRFNLDALSDADLAALYKQADAQTGEHPALAGMSDDQLRQLYEQSKAGAPGMEGVIPAFNRWATFGLADPAGAAAGAGYQKLVEGNEKPFGELYQTGLTQRRGEANNFASEHPWANGIAALAGAGATLGYPLSPVISSVTGRMGAGAGIGAGIGATSGAANSRDNPLRDAAIGATVGGVGGGLAPVVGELASVPINAVSRRFLGGADSQALDRIGNRIAQDTRAGGPSMGDMQQALAGANGKPLTLADVAGENTSALAGRMTRSPGEGREASNRFLAERSGGTGPRLLGDVDAGLPIGSAFDTSEALMQQRATAAAPLYEQANAANTAISSPEIQAILDTPAGKSALAAAKVKMANDRTPAGPQGFPDLAVPGAQATTEPPRPADLIQFLLSRGGVKDEGGELGAMDLQRINRGYFGRLSRSNGMPLDEARAAAAEAGYLHSDADINDLLGALKRTSMGQPVFNESDPAAIAWREFDRARSRGDFEIPFGTATETPMGAQSGLPEYNLRTLDYVKRALDDQIGGSLRGGANDEARILTGLKKNLVSALENADTTAVKDESGNIVQHGLYKQARDAFAGPSALNDAMETGQTFRSMRPEQIEATLKDYGPSEREFFRLGAADAMRHEVSRTGDPRVLIGSNAVNQRGGDLMKQQLRPLFDTEDAYNRFVGDVGNEALMGANTGRWVGNSATAGRLAEDAGNHGPGGPLVQGATLVGAALTGEPALALSRAPGFIRSLQNAGELGANNPRVNAATAQRLFSADQGQNADTLAQIIARAGRPGLSQRAVPPLASALAGVYPQIALPTQNNLAAFLARNMPGAGPSERP